MFHSTQLDRMQNYSHSESCLRTCIFNLKMSASKHTSDSGFTMPRGFNDPNNHGRIIFTPTQTTNPEKERKKEKTRLAPPERTAFNQGWGILEKSSKSEQKDPVRPLVIFCKKMLDNVHTENYRNFFQGLISDLTDDDFLGETSLQPVPIKQQDAYVLLDQNIIPKEAKFAEVIAHNDNYVTCKIVLNNDLGFLILEENPLTYSEIYAALELDRISTLRVRFIRNL
jgi:hypothetical protein